MLDLSLFRHPRFVGVQALPVATCYCYVVLLVLMPMRFIGIDGLGEIQAGLATAALSLPMLFMPSVAAWLARGVSPGLISALGLAAAAGLWLGAVDIRASALAAIWPMLLIGAGAGLPWGLMDGLAMPAWRRPNAPAWPPASSAPPASPAKASRWPASTRCWPA